MNKQAEKKLDNEIVRGTARIGMDKWDEVLSMPFPEETFGLCSTCKILKAARTRYGRVRAECYEFEVELYGIDPVTECTVYERRGQLTLQHMQDIAILIDFTKQPAGFNTSPKIKKEKENAKIQKETHGD